MDKIITPLTRLIKVLDVENVGFTSIDDSFEGHTIEIDIEGHDILVDEDDYRQEWAVEILLDEGVFKTHEDVVTLIEKTFGDHEDVERDDGVRVYNWYLGTEREGLIQFVSDGDVITIVFDYEKV